MENTIRAALLVQFYGHLVEAKKTGVDTHYDHLADDVVEEIIQELRLRYNPRLNEKATQWAAGVTQDLSSSNA